MELIMSMTAVIISSLSVGVAIFIYWKGEQRQKKQATLDAFNLLQEQVLDKLNMYSFKQIQEISQDYTSDD